MINIFLEPVTDPGMNKIAVGTASLLLGLVFFVIALIYYKKKSTGKILIFKVKSTSKLILL